MHDDTHGYRSPVGPRWSQKRSGGAAAVAVLVALAFAVGADVGEAGDERLSTTLLGRLEPGGQPRLAVRWDGPPGALLDAWVDLDGDGALGGHELVVAGRPLMPGIEVVRLEIPAEAHVVAEPSVWVQALEPDPGVHAAEGCLSSARSDGCAWQPGFTVADLNREVGATAVYDDGSGLALYAGGEFTIAGGVTVNNVAKWNGSGWSALQGPSGTGMGTDYPEFRSHVDALAVFDDGSGPALFAGGTFTYAAGVTVNSIAKWNGTGWSALPGPAGTGIGRGSLGTKVRALAVFDDGSGPALFAGGSFYTAGGLTVDNIAKWDGTAWSAVSDPSNAGMNDSVSGLIVFDDGSGPALFAGGAFTTAGGVNANHIAKWNGSAWSDLSGPSGTGMGGTYPYVNALTVFDDGSGPALFAGGRFTTAGGVTANCIARWDGSAWSALSDPSGSGMDSPVSALAVFDDGSGPALFAGGAFTTAGGVDVNYIAKWNGDAWSDLSGPSGTGMGGTYPNVNALTVFDDGSGPVLYASGKFTTAGGVAVNRIAKWKGIAWSVLSGPSGPGMSGLVYALTVFDDGSGPALFAGGDFTFAGGAKANGIARWDGTAWSELSVPSGTGLDGDGWAPRVHALAIFDDGSGPALFAGGLFTTAGGATVNHIAKWNGSAWSDLSGPSGTGLGYPDWAIVYALAVFDDGSGPALFAGGTFTTAGGVTVNHIAKWDGTAWSDLPGPSGTGMAGTFGNLYVRAVAVFDDGSRPALFAGGSFDTAGGVTVDNIAKWDGTAWSDLSGPSDTGTDFSVRALVVFDGGSGPALFAGGDFHTAGGLTVSKVARWDGSAWSGLSGPSGTGTDCCTSALTVFDDGSGAALYAGGCFTTAGGVTANSIARWDGSAWSGLSGPSGTGMDGVHPSVYTLAPFDHGSGPTLYAGGYFDYAGGMVSSYIAAWRCAGVFADGFESGDTTAWSLTVR